MCKMNFINATPHTVNIFNAAGEQVEVVPPFFEKGQEARLTVSRELVGVESGVEIYKATFGEPSPLPSEADGVGYIVSALYANGLRASGDKRTDIFTPGEAKRNEAKQVIGCVGLNVV